MKRTYAAILVATMITLASGDADARRKGSGGGSGVQTNYGCSILSAGTVVQSPEGATQKRLLSPTSTCYLCNLSNGVCTLQSPPSLVGWTFVR